MTPPREPARMTAVELATLRSFVAREEQWGHYIDPVVVLRLIAEVERCWAEIAALRVKVDDARTLLQGIGDRERQRAQESVEEPR